MSPSTSSLYIIPTETVSTDMDIIRCREIIYLRSFLEERNGDTSDVLFFFSK